ncbi:hypothetical protein ABBQ38_009637 [Trebouxia sp. C0009 RCD-2024]
MSQAGQRQRLSLPVDNQLEDLLMWRDPVRTGGIFGVVTLVYLLLEWSNYSLLSLIANGLLVLVCIAFLWSNGASFLNKPGPPIPAVLQHGISDNQSKMYAEELTSGVNQLLGFARRLVQGNDVVLSVEAAAILYATAKIGNYFSTLGLAYTVVVLLFSLPKIYELKKHEIDSATNKVVNQSKQAYSQYGAPYVQKIPRASTSTTSNYSKPNAYDSSADSASVAPNGPNEYKKTY